MVVLVVRYIVPYCTTVVVVMYGAAYHRTQIRILLTLLKVLRCSRREPTPIPSREDALGSH